ncbi:uncharacterized protein CDV56_105507 [Aspergillus thermomutatus]|uniref:Stress response protein rds1p n=1 Tax=Aspergillus thermomutatus TaxID=41047 RepID=A0A397GLA8_ASPTH|nr:uncharacterized protein CDV56_105507 [Aspergillus thermomutatus]RHZ51801.1 hypothetical protein CDV56_105507 [Aspergillus thermomutatus]
MHWPSLLVASAAFVVPCLALPTTSSQGNSPQSAEDAVPGESYLFTTYTGKKTPLAANYTRVIPPTDPDGSPDPDDVLWQNLASAEWIIYSFYQQAVEAFSPSDFTALGLPNTTYQRIAEIRDNEAGHLRIFQDQISNHSLKPGPCKYEFGFNKSTPEIFLALQVYIEVSSMAFLTGLSRQANLNVSKSALMAVGQVETRHNVWSLIDVYNTSPFSGPADTVYPYANQILDTTNNFVVPGSCPKANPVYPNPRQGLPLLAFSKNGTTARLGSKIHFLFEDPDNQPQFEDETEYYAVFYHGINTVSVPFDRKTNSSTIPARFDPESSIIMVNIADRRDAPTEESVVAGPLIILEQPGSLTLEEPTAV